MRVSRLVLFLFVLGLSIGARAQPPRDGPARDTARTPADAIIRGRVLVALRQSSGQALRQGSGQALRQSSGPSIQQDADQSDRPLSRVEVRALNPTLKIDRAVLTDGSGRYAIAGLPAGRYTMTFSRAGFVRAVYGQRRPLGPGTPIDVAAAQAVTLGDAALQRSGVITGRIVDEFGDPMTGVQVMPMRYGFSNNRRRLQMSGPSALTNDVGEYRLFGLAPGHYYLSAISRNLNAAADARTSYAPMYYPGTGNAAEAQRLTVAPGQTLPSIDFTLAPVAAVRVSGVAYDGSGKPFERAWVSLSPAAGSAIYGTLSSDVQPDGTFSIGGATPGDYTLRAFRPNASDESATVDLTVSSSDVSGVQLAATKGATLRGRIAFEAGSARPPAAPAVRFNVLHPDTTAIAMMTNPEAAKSDGTFELKTSAGRTVIRAAVFGGGEWRLRRVLSPTGVDVTDDGFDVPSGASIDGLVVELTSRLPELSGIVVDAAGARLRDYVVVVFATDQRPWTTGTRHFAVARPDADDVFHARVPAGDYYAAAFELDEPLVSLDDPDILHQLRDRATTLSLGDAEKKTLTLTLCDPPIY